MAAKFKLVVKNGDIEYKFDSKLGYNKQKTTDRVEEYDTFERALEEFMYCVNDEYGENKVSLTYTRPKEDRKK